MKQGNLSKKNGTPTGTRTQDPMIKSHLLYQLSYGRTLTCSFPDHAFNLLQKIVLSNFAVKKKRFFYFFFMRLLIIGTNFFMCYIKKTTPRWLKEVFHG